MSDPSTDEQSQEPEHTFDGSFPVVRDEAPDTKPWIYWTGLALISLLVLYGLVHVATTDAESQGIEVTIQVTGGGAEGANVEAPGEPEGE